MSLLRLRVVALTEVHVADVSVLVDEVVGRPVVVAVRLPGAVVVVERDRIANAEPLHGGAHVAEIVLERELGRVHAEDDQALRAVARVPGLQIRKRAQAVDARVGPEVDEHDLAAQLGKAERSAC